MKLYRFRTFRTAYYFPETDAQSRFLYGVYHPYGILPVKLYWKLFTSCGWVRGLSAIEGTSLPFPYQHIMEMCPQGAVLSFNMGTPSEEQKMSMLGYLPATGDSFFAKYSTKEKAMTLSRNEIRVLKELNGMAGAPLLLDAKDNGYEVFFRTSRVNGKACSSFELTERILDILVTLGSAKLKGRDEDVEGLMLCLSHGDFCPWNMLQDGTEIRLIDWEMAANRPLGYDLFLFIIHTHLVMGADENRILALLKENTNYIDKYFNAFNISDYRPYLLSFLTARLKDEQDKAHQQMMKHYQQILLSI